MDNAHSNSVDFDQETDVILTSREIFHVGKEDKTEVVEKPKYTYQESILEKVKVKENIKRVHETFKCNSCVKSFDHQQNFKRHICTVHESPKDYKCNFERARKRHYHLGYSHFILVISYFGLRSKYIYIEKKVKYKCVNETRY